MNIGIIGGSGLYQLGDDFKGTSVAVETPYGAPSGKVTKIETTEGNTLLFIPRHGEGHVLLPSEVPYRANIFALKKLGAEAVISVSAVGSLRKEISPGDLVLPDQYIDRTNGQRPGTFFGRGVVAHAHFADPTCHVLRNHVKGLAQGLGVRLHEGGTYVCMEGPQFSTRAESHWYRSWEIPGGRKACVIGMTALPEAKLAREAGLCYQTIAMSTDYDCWNEEAGDVSVDAILKVLHQNVNFSRNLVTQIAKSKMPSCQRCKNEMKHAVVTSREIWPKDRVSELEIILR
jgi:5'-methylthioadenosine phosphorylase